MNKDKNKNNKGLSRIDSGSTHGWFVRGYKNGKTYSKLFSDRKYEGKEKALIAARAHRDSLFNGLKLIPQSPRARRIVCRDSRNKTGILGVCKISKKGADGKINYSYSVTWRPEPGIQKCTSFSIRKYGDEEAFRLAVALRRQMMEEIHLGGKSNRRQSRGKVAA